MSNADGLARLHEFLKDPIRRRILLKLSELGKLSFDDLMKELKIDDQEQVHDQLSDLDGLVTRTNDDSKLYVLTEDGHYAVEELIAFSEIESDNYRKSLDKNGEPKKAWYATDLKSVVVKFAIMISILTILYLLAVYFHFKWSIP